MTISYLIWGVFVVVFSKLDNYLDTRTRVNREINHNGTRPRRHNQMWFPRRKKLGMQTSRHVGTDVLLSKINCTVWGLIHILISNFSKGIVLATGSCLGVSGFMLFTKFQWFGNILLVSEVYTKKILTDWRVLTCMGWAKEWSYKKANLRHEKNETVSFRSAFVSIE